MIQTIGLKNNLNIEIREKLSLSQSRLCEFMEKINLLAHGSLILSTCNRTEIYIDSKDIFPLDKLFQILEWDESLMKYIFHESGRNTVSHLMEVSCGFHSKIYGEDQILSQIRSAFQVSTENKTTSSSLHRLFQLAVTCGKEFRCKSGLNKIPVSSSSIVSRECSLRKTKSIMLIGYGEVGRLVEKYILSTDVENVYIVVRNKSNIIPIDERITFIEFNEKVIYYKKVQCIISCTSSPHIIVSDNDLPNSGYTLFDMAVPRDIDENISKRSNIELIDIDKISLLDDANKEKRKNIMNNNRIIIEDKINEFLNHESIKEIVPHIQVIKSSGNRVAEERVATFRNKKNTKDSEDLARAMIESTSNFYVNRAIKVLKNAQLKGCGDDCLNYIKEIFMEAE